MYRLHSVKKPGHKSAEVPKRSTGYYVLPPSSLSLFLTRNSVKIAHRGATIYPPEREYPVAPPPPSGQPPVGIAEKPIFRRNSERNVQERAWENYLGIGNHSERFSSVEGEGREDRGRSEIDRASRRCSRKVKFFSRLERLRMTLASKFIIHSEIT